MTSETRLKNLLFSHSQGGTFFLNVVFQDVDSVPVKRDDTWSEDFSKTHK